MSKTTKTPGYVSFCQSIAADLRAAGIGLAPQATVEHGLEGNKGWVCFRRIDTQQAIYVSRTDAKLTVHTTLPVDPATPGYVTPPSKPNGKIAAHFAADLDLIKRHLIPLFVGNTPPLRANRTPVRGTASGTASSLARVGTMDDLTAGLPID